MTTINWLKTEIYPKMEFISYEDRVAMNKIFEKAIEIEKEQIIKAFSDGQELSITNPLLPHYSSEQYYNDTYNR